MSEEQKAEFRKLIGEKRLIDGVAYTCLSVDYQWYFAREGDGVKEIECAFVYLELNPPLVQSVGILMDKWKRLPIAGD